MLCVDCLDEAMFIYMGMSVCAVHFDTRRAAKVESDDKFKRDWEKIEERMEGLNDTS